MAYKLFYCCLDVSEKTAYLFINILDVIYSLSNTLNGFEGTDKKGVGILSIIWVICAVGSLIVYLVHKDYKTQLHYVYMVLRFFFVIFELVMLIFAIIAISAAMSQKQHDQAENLAAALIVCIISSIVVLYDLYLSFLLKRIVQN